MSNKVIDINEWLRWVISLHPSQKQINTIKPYWKCKSKEDYLKVFKKDIGRFGKPIPDINDTEWIDGKYSWELDRLFDIYKFVPECEQLAKVNIGYFVLQETLEDNKWQDYIQVIKQYDKEVKDVDGLCTFRVIMVDFGIFKLYARQTRELEGPHRHVMYSNIKNKELEEQNKLIESWSDNQCIFISISGIKINKDLIKGKFKKIELQKEKRLYCFNDNNGNKYQLPELYYPNNIRTFIDYCIDKKILPFSKSIRIWSKTDYYEIYSDPENKSFNDYKSETEMLYYYPFPMMNIKSKKELKEYINDRKQKRAYEINRSLPKTVTINYSINDIFIPIDSINQDICNKFIDKMNNSKLYEIIQ